MKLLREFVRSCLSEAARGPGDLPENYFIIVRSLGSDAAVFRIVDSEKGSDHSIGEVGIKKPEGDDGPCDGAWVVVTASAEKGWGPMLYDIAIEYATAHGNGLTPDRLTVSGDALRVWNHYLNQRSDVKAYQLDDPVNTLTPIDRDNCEQRAADMDSFETRPREELAGNKAAFALSALSKRYTKAPTTINALKKAGKLRIEK